MIGGERRLLKFLPARAGRGGAGAKTSHRIVMKFCTGVDVPDIITYAKFCGHQFRGYEDTGGQISHFH